MITTSLFTHRPAQGARAQQRGFLLPVVIILSVAISIVGVTVMQVTASTSSTLNNEYYSQLGNEAAQSGLTYAASCLKSSTTAWTTLTPKTDCSGNNTTGKESVAEKDNWKSTFQVGPPQLVGTNTIVTSVGTVTLYNSSNVPIKTLPPITLKESIPTNKVIPISSGNSVTDIISDTANCAIANGQLYCWGRNFYGELGIGNITNQNTPQHVTAFIGKRVTEVTMGTDHACAIADGDLYCWGSNWSDFDVGMLGVGSACTAQKCTIPQRVGGALANKKVTKVSASQSASDNDFTCAIADGVVYCWGEGGVQGLGQINYIYIPFVGYRPNILIPNTNKLTTPTPVYGYHTESNTYDADAQLYQKKSSDVATGFGGACSVTEGKIYCWGSAWSLLSIDEPTLQNGGTLASKMARPGSLTIAGSTGCVAAASIGASDNGMQCWGYVHNSCSIITSVACDFPINLYNGNFSASDDSQDIATLDAICVVSNGSTRCRDGGPRGTDVNGSTFPIVVSSSATIGKIATKVGTGGNPLLDHACMVSNGSVQCWGQNNIEGQLGNGTNTGSSIPVAVAGGIGTTDGTAAANDTSTGTTHACGIANGQLYCWGDNTYGQLGTGDKLSKNVPTATGVSGGMIFTKISSGAKHTCGIANYRVYCWGDNTYGQLGNTSSESLAPTLVAGLTGGATDISAGDTSTCAVVDSQAYCWGDNSSRQIGDNTSVALRSTPSLLTTLSGQSVTSISVGAAHACAVANATAYCWGANAHYATGQSTATGTTNIPTIVSGGTADITANNVKAAVTAIGAGNSYTCAVINGTVSCWGLNTSGQTGTGSASSSINIPTLVSGAAGTMLANDISAGDTHACAALEGHTYCWGANGNGQIGNNSTTLQPSPAPIDGGTLSGQTTTRVSAGTNTSCSVANAVISCWGNGGNSQIGNTTVNAVNSLPQNTSNYVILSPVSDGIRY